MNFKLPSQTKHRLKHRMCPFTLVLLSVARHTEKLQNKYLAFSYTCVCVFAQMNWRKKAKPHEDGKLFKFL